MVYCIIIYLSFPICDWLLIREVHCFYWTWILVVPAEKMQWECQWGDSNSQPLSYKPSALAIELNSSRASAEKELCYFIRIPKHVSFICYLTRWFRDLKAVFLSNLTFQAQKLYTFSDRWIRMHSLSYFLTQFIECQSTLIQISCSIAGISL